MNKETISFTNTAVTFSGRSTAQLKQAYWLFRLMGSPTLTNIGIPISNWALKAGLPVKGIIRNTIFKQFVGGETVADCQTAIERLASRGVGVILDYSVEGAKDEAGFDRTCQEILQTVHVAQNNPAIPFAVFKVTGLARFALLAKINAHEALSAAERAEFSRARNRIERICKACYEADVSVLIDAEHCWIQDVIDKLALEMMGTYNRKQAIVYQTYQLYRHDKLASLKADYRQACMEGFYLGAKLVRGAYMEIERARAEEKGYLPPIHANKTLTDACFDEGLRFCLDHLHRISLIAATHNEQSCLKLLAAMNEQNLSPQHPSVYFAQLLGMSDNLSINLAQAGYRVVKYMPYGPLQAVMPYLFRRAQENTSVAGQTSRELALLSNELKRRKGK